MAELPSDRPRYLMGVGHPRDLVDYARLGVDLFDCVLPTRLGRSGAVWSDVEGSRLNLSRRALLSRRGPIMRECPCAACRDWSVGSLAALFQSRAPLALRLASMHNLAVLGTLASKAQRVSRLHYLRCPALGESGNQATTDSARVTPTASGPAVAQAAENVGTRAPAAVRAERRAWLILWVAFATFCALVFAAIKFAVDYVSTAEVDQGARVTASRGPVIVNLPGSADMTLLGARSELGVGTVVALDRTSVATVDLQFFDDSRINVLGGATDRADAHGSWALHQPALAGAHPDQRPDPLRDRWANGRAGAEWAGAAGAARRLHGVDRRRRDPRARVWRRSARFGQRRAVNVGEGRLAQIDAQGQVHPAVDRQVPLLANSDFGLHDQNWEPWDKPNIPGLDVNGQRSWVPGPLTIRRHRRLPCRLCVSRSKASTARQASSRSSTVTCRASGTSGCGPGCESTTPTSPVAARSGRSTR